MNWISYEPDDQNRLVKICVFNTVALEQLEEDFVHEFNKKKFLPYLQEQAKTQFQNVTYKDIRENAINPDFRYKIGEHHKVRVPDSLCTVFCNEIYLDQLGTYISDWESMHGYEDFVAVVISGFLTFVGFPLYLLSRLFHILLPLFIVLYLYIDGGIVLFIDIAPFQVIMWLLFVILLSVWFLLLRCAIKKEYYLWHILPNIKHLKGWEENQYRHDEISWMIEDKYTKIAILPVIQEILTDALGHDVSYVVIDYLSHFDGFAVISEQLLVDKFGSKISSIIQDFCRLMALNWRKIMVMAMMMMMMMMMIYDQCKISCLIYFCLAHVKGGKILSADE